MVNQSKHKLSLCLILLTTVILLTGCVTLSDPESAQEYASHPIGEISPGSHIGQTFIFRRPFVNSITIWISGEEQSNVSIKNAELPTLDVELFEYFGEHRLLFTTSVQIIAHNGPLQILINPVNIETGRSYYLNLSSERGKFTVYGKIDDVYAHGSAYLNNQPLGADLAFRTSYEYNWLAFRDDLSLWIKNAWLILPVAAILLLPGWFLLEYLGISSIHDFFEKLAFSAGISLSVIPVLMLWTSQFNLRWSSNSILFGMVLLFLLVIARKIIRRLKRSNQRFRVIQKEFKNTFGDSSNPIINNWITRPTTSISLAMVGVILLSTGVRIIMVRDLVTPAWVDSVHHALITRTILQEGSFPQNYLPYFDINPKFYHPGFHSQLAAFIWLTGINIAQGLLIFGQALNSIAILGVYLLTNLFTKDARAGLVAAFITGILTPMPAYYTSWGRYSQLAGLIVLPASMVLFARIKSEQNNALRWKAAILFSVTVSGLFLIHYRVIAFLICLIIPFLLVNAFDRKHSSPSPKDLYLIITLIGLVTIILTAPWLPATVSEIILPRINQMEGQQVKFFSDFSWQFLTSASGKESIVIASLGLLLSTLNKKKFSIIIPAWIILLLILANLDALGLPGGGFVNNTSVEIIFFIPISILGGYFISNLTYAWSTTLPKNIHKPLLILIGCVMLVFTYSSSKKIINILNPTTILTRQGDLEAIAWIQQNIPKEETILISPFLWGYGLYAGNDGGYWISPLAGLKTIPPPVLYGLSDDDDVYRINEISQNIIDYANDPSELWSLMKKNNLNYIYIGTRNQFLSPKIIYQSAYFETLYNRNGAWLFEIKP
jgi:hypothetical protein